eukprot:XP_019924737.1 PREDICTED: uncharacterized protein LOC105332920 [Crassostrea gigas]
MQDLRLFFLSIFVFVGGVHVSQQSRHGAVVSRSVTGRRSYITLKCPKDHVFANVKFRLQDNRVNTNYNKCLVNSLVAQKRCRWHRRCKINTKAKTLNCSASAIQLSNLKCVPKDSFVNICKSAETGAVWITNYGRLKRTQVKGQCKRIRKHAIRIRTRRGVGQRRPAVKGVVTQENGIIQDRVGWQKKAYKYSCPNGSVIHSIDLLLSYVPYAKRSKPLCQGLSPQLLVQKNNCFWKESCKVSWDSPQVMAMSHDTNCIGKQGSLFTTREHQCMPKKNILDICKKREAKGKRGLLRSHDDYPWNYRAQPQKCTTLIKIKPEGALYLRLHDVDLDTRRDELRVLHVGAGRPSCSLKHSSLQEGVWLYGGYIKIQFTVHHRTRSGRGFIMSYKNVKERLPRNHVKKSDICSQV